MKNNTELLKEELGITTTSLFKYFALIDSMEILENNRGMLLYLFPEMKMEKIRSWYRYLYDSDLYSNKELKKKLTELSSRFYGDETLKLLYRSLNKLISTTFPEADRAEREADVRRLVKKITVYIKNRLTDDDKNTVETAFPLLDSVSKTITKNLINSLDTHTERPKEVDDSDEDYEEPVSKKDASDEEEAGKEPKKEALHDNFYKRKLKKKIREMIRTAIIDKKFSVK